MPIIAISGYAGSGKDLAAKLIQHMHLPKDSRDKHPDLDKFAKEDTDWWLGDVCNWHIMKFAGKLKHVASLLTGIPVQNFEDQRFKKTNLPKQWDRHIPGEDWHDGHPVEIPMTVREFLQKLGTDGLRDNLHENVWVNALFADYVPDMSGYSDRMAVDDLQTLYPNWLITDCRFPNEAQAVKDHGGIIIRIDRPGITAVNAHPSETALDDYPFDEHITNRGSIKDLYDKLKFIIDKQNVCYP